MELQQRRRLTDARAAAVRAAHSPPWRAVAAAVSSRAYILLIAFAATYLFGMGRPSWSLRFPSGAETFSGVLGHLLNPWAHWDGVWFIKIARAGYADADGSTAFFPLYPLLLRWGGVLFDGDLLVTGIVLSLACYAAAMVLLYRLVRDDFGERVASLTVVLVALVPTTLFFQAVYTESLFLLLSVACFRWSRDGSWKLAGLAGLLATLTRSTGVLLVLPMAVFYLQQREWDWRRVDQHVVNLLMVPLGLLAWMTYLSLAFGRPLLFVQAQGEWKRSLAAPSFALGRGVWASVMGVRQLLSGQRLDLYWWVPNPASAYNVAVANLTDLAFVAVALLLLWWGWRRLPRAYGVYFLAAVAYPLCFPAAYLPLLSFPRFALTVFPAFVTLALFLLPRRRARWAVLVFYVLALTALTAKFAAFSWVA